jgi:hypothetical protein
MARKASFRFHLFRTLPGDRFESVLLPIKRGIQAMRVVRTVAWPASLVFCVSLLIAGCGGDDSAETSSSENSAADTAEPPATPGEPVARDPSTPAADAVAGSEAGFEQSEPDAQTTDASDEADAQADKEAFAPGSFFAAVGGGQEKLKLVLLESGGVEQFLKGQKIETIKSKAGDFEASKIKWTVVGQEVALRLPNRDAVFYRIEDPDTLVGPVARLAAGGEREVTAASSRQVFKRGLGSTVATSDDGEVPAEKPVRTTAAAQPPVNAKVGLEVGNLAPEIIGEDIDGKKFRNCGNT